MLNINLPIFKASLKTSAFAVIVPALSGALIVSANLTASCQNAKSVPAKEPATSTEAVKTKEAQLGKATKEADVSKKADKEPVKDTLEGVKIDWPPGWQRQELDGLEMGASGPLGVRIRALKKVNSRLVAIEFATIPRTDNGQAELAEECKIMEHTVKDSYAAKKMEAAVSPAKDATLGGLPAQEVEILVSSDPQLKQRIIMALGKDTLYSMSYSALKDDFDSQVATFEGVLKTMTLK